MPTVSVSTTPALPSGWLDGVDGLEGLTYERVATRFRTSRLGDALAGILANAASRGAEVVRVARAEGHARRRRDRAHHLRRETTDVQAFLRQLAVNLRLHFRNRMALIYGYLFPTMFLLAFWALYRYDQVPLVRHIGELLTIAAARRRLFWVADDDGERARAWACGGDTGSRRCQPRRSWEARSPRATCCSSIAGPAPGGARDESRDAVAASSGSSSSWRSRSSRSRSWVSVS